MQFLVVDSFIQFLIIVLKLIFPTPSHIGSKLGNPVQKIASLKKWLKDFKQNRFRRLF